MFELFAQTDRGGTPGGLGIGLALVKNLVELHGGSVEARSDGEGRGSRFLVRLPLSVVEIREKAVLGAPQPAVKLSQRVLVIDDMIDAADSLALLLRSYGCEVRVANSGAEGLRLCREFRPALVFLDIGMPEMDGFETAKRMRALPEGREATIVALTGWGEERTRRRVMDAGFDQHMTKPADLGALETLLFASAFPA